MASALDWTIGLCVWAVNRGVNGAGDLALDMLSSNLILAFTFFFFHIDSLLVLSNYPATSSPISSVLPGGIEHCACALPRFSRT